MFPPGSTTLSLPSGEVLNASDLQQYSQLVEIPINGMVRASIPSNSIFVLTGIAVVPFMEKMLDRPNFGQITLRQGSAPKFSASVYSLAQGRHSKIISFRLREGFEIQLQHRCAEDAIDAIHAVRRDLTVELVGLVNNQLSLGLSWNRGPWGP